MATTYTLTLPLEGRSTFAMTGTVNVFVSGGGITRFSKIAQNLNSSGVLTFTDSQDLTDGTTVCVTVKSWQHLRRSMIGTAASGAITINLASGATFDEMRFNKLNGKYFLVSGDISGIDTGTTSFHKNFVSGWDVGYWATVNGTSDAQGNLDATGTVDSADLSLIIRNIDVEGDGSLA